MYENILKGAGLTDVQALTYESLLKHGESTAAEVIRFINQKKGLTYKTLDQLVELGYVVKNETVGKVTTFTATNPSAIRNTYQAKLNEITDAKALVEQTMPQMLSDYFLASDKPEFVFYRGKEGVVEVLNDTLNSKTEILLYGDLESVIEFIPEETAKYSKKREKLGIKKKGIAFDTPAGRKYLTGHLPAITKTKFIRYEKTEPFNTIMQVYDDKVSYMLLSKEKMFGVIIQDKYIASMHRMFYDLIWKTAPGDIV